MSKKQYPSVDYIRQCFRYEKGKLFWLERPRHHFPQTCVWAAFNARFPGKEAICIDKRKNGNRCRIRINNKPYYRSVIVWVLHNGRWPNGTIDHKDRNTLNDSIENLREATYTQNMHNRHLSCKNTSGFKGVSFHKTNNRWVSRIRIHGSTISLGCYATAKEAGKAYLNAALKYHGEFACTG